MANKYDEVFFEYSRGIISFEEMVEKVNALKAQGEPQ